MKGRAGLFATCAALVIGAGLASPAFAGEKPSPMAAAEPMWTYDGFAEIGGRFDLNHPDKTTLGKFYQYRDLRPGVFGNFLFGAHRSGADPFDFVAWGKNVGWDDQAYGLDLASPGAYYLTLGWDETPHVFANNAKTTFGPIGGNVLSTPTYPTAGGVPTAATAPFVSANSTLFDLKYRRDTARTQFRWTPTDDVDVNVDYSYTHRDGTQGLSALTFSLPAGRGGADTRAPTELPKPVDDVTQNGNIKGEYAGSTPWGKPFNVALGYGFSVYQDSFDSLTFQNPWTAANTATDPLWNRYSLWPDNQAQTVNLSGGVGLPFNSRYMGTIQYSIMTQDDPFLPSNSNPLAALATVPRSSLNGDARTTLSNNVLHTDITSTLKSTLRYRYYDYHSNQAPMTITGLVTNPDTTAAVGAEPPLTAVPINFTKQNASADLAWQALKWLTVGSGYAWERWDRSDYYSDVAVTNENTVKAFANANLGWSTLRTSLQYGERRYDGTYFWDSATNESNTANNNSNFRVKEYSNRNRTKGMVSWAIDLPQNIEVTPNGGFRYDDYGIIPFSSPGTGEIGLKSDHSWNAGADVSWNMNHSVAFYVSYTHEDGYLQIYQNSAAPTLNMETRDKTDTVIFGGKVTVIPEKLFVNVNYTYTRSTSAWDSNCTVYGCLNTPQPTFPVNASTLNRVDVQAKYLLDHTSGFVGQPFIKARVLWERLDSYSWQAPLVQSGLLLSGDTTTQHWTIFGIGPPNYDVVVGQVSVGVKW
jgi:MtrB/PioB family decaheme-associated outer membrane protein